VSGHLLVTGGAGFIGANLADRLAAEGHQVLVLDALRRPGVEANLHWLKQRHPRQVASVVADIRDRDAVAKAVRDAQAVFHLAAQVAVTTSLVDPAEDFGVNLQGTFGLLDALRRRKGGACPLVFASTNKVYGCLADVAMERGDEGWQPCSATLRTQGVPEEQPLDFQTPYGCSKGAADQYVLDHARSYGLPFAVLRMSCIYGPRQMGTEDQGWVAHFLIRALRGESVTIFGDGQQVRDVLHVDDAVAAWIAAWRRIGSVAGRAFNLGGGPGNAVSLRRMLEEIGTITGRRVETTQEAERSGDQRWFVADTRRARAALELPAPIAWREGLRDLAAWLMREGSAATDRRAMEAAT
jgi:CDP-paratose 2-epimerase